MAGDCYAANTSGVEVHKLDCKEEMEKLGSEVYDSLQYLDQNVDINLSKIQQIEDVIPL